MAIAILCTYGVKVYNKNEFNNDYMSKDGTASIRGIFVLLILASHFKQYVVFDGVYDKGYLAVSRFLLQTVVVMFLFYSGYGILEAVKHRGYDYVKTMPYKRILITWIHVAVAIMCYIVMNYFLNITYDYKSILCAFIGWRSIGNSSWYIFAILYHYIISYISFFIFRKRMFVSIISVTAFSLLYIVVLKGIYPDVTTWYNTSFCYVLGMWYSYFKKDIEKILFSHSKIYFACLWGCIFMTYFLRPHLHRLLTYEIWVFFFTISVVLLTMKISVNNAILRWFGHHTFEIYILQRIPMKLLTEMGMDVYPYIMGCICFVLVLLIAFIFGEVLKRIDKKVLRFFTY